MMEIKAYQANHVTDKLYRDYAIMHETTKGEGYSAFIDGQLVASGGIHLISKKVGQAWLFITPLFFQHKTETYRIIKMLLDKMESSYGLHRIQATITMGHEMGERFAEHLGFYYEGIMKKFSDDGADHKLYARVK